LFDLLGVRRAVAQRQQRAVEGGTVEIEQTDLLDQAAGLDQLTDAGLASRVLELGFGLCG
jgi:hypothetical protein